MQEEVFQLIADVMGIDKSMVNINSSPQTLDEWDSMNHMRLILSLEETFGIRFVENDIMNMEDVEAIIKCIESKQ